MSDEQKTQQQTILAEIQKNRADIDALIDYIFTDEFKALPKDEQELITGKCIFMEKANGVLQLRYQTAICNAAV